MAGKKNPSIASLWSSGGRLVRQWRWLLLLAGSVFYGGMTLSIHGQGTAAFSYQGRLNASGSPAQGNFDFQFSLMNQESSGSKIGEILQLDDVEVSDGLFSVSLDFGFGAFGGNPRWLEISVRASGSGLDFTTLTPRQRITAVPYALFAMTPAGPIGPSGATGPVGPQGPAGPPGPAGGGTLADVAAGVSVSSQIAADPELTTLGFQQIASVPAPNWVSGSVANQPAARERHSIVWTGTELLVWGGVGASHSPLSTGARYDGASDLWTPISPIDAPSGRSDHSGIWSGDKLLVWGGFGASGYLASGGIYDPDRQTWASVSTVNAPIARSEHAAVWNGRMMIVWGGQNDAGLLSDGAMYDPETSTWFPLNLPGAPLARRAATGVWTGDRLIVWGGEGGNRELGDGAQLVFDANGVPLGWQAVSGIAAPGARRGHSAIWTGTRLLVWGGSRGGSFLNDGGSYDPISDVWTPISSVSAPVGRRFHGSVWTGSEMIVWAGDGAGGALASGGAYSPTNDTWRPLTNGGAPTARSRFGMAWSGNELLVFGGTSTGGVVGALERVAPQPTWYFYRKP